MKTKISVFILLFLVVETISFAQEKTKKQIKEEHKLALQKEVEVLVNSREFYFIARTAFPIGYKTVNLSINSNYVKFHPSLIESYMPFFGKAYGGVRSGNDTGLFFKGEPEEYTVRPDKKSYTVRAVVKGSGDNFTLTLTVSFDSSAMLSIVSNNRSTISYQGQIYPPLQQEEK